MNSLSLNRKVKHRAPLRTLGEGLRRQFGCRVHKVSIHAGLTCPNRDGTLGTSGCVYCGPTGSAASWADQEMTITDQLRCGMAHAKKRFHADRFIAYFQAFTNTFAPARRLQKLWDEALAVEEVVGLSVGTRPDCLPEEILDLVQSYAQSLPYFCLEIGLQSIHDKTLLRIRRGHDFTCFADALDRIQKRDIPVCVHIILGLPGESRQEMMETVQALLDWGVQGVKLHHLHILKGTFLEQEYLKGDVRLFEMDEYIHLVCEILDLIAGRMVIHRFMGEAPENLLLAPSWTRKKNEVLAAIYREFGET